MVTCRLYQPADFAQALRWMERQLFGRPSLHPQNEQQMPLGLQAI